MRSIVNLPMKPAMLALVALLSLPRAPRAESVPVEPNLLQQLQSTVQQQQEQLRQQAEQIRLQAEKLDALRQKFDALHSHEPGSSSAPSASATAKQNESVPRQDISPRLTICSGNERIKLSLSGQVNRAVNIANDGQNTDIFHVDNNASNSRIRFIGSGRIDDDLSVGTRIEFAVAPDVSSQVSQTSQTPGTWFDQRWTEISLTSARYGKLSIGKGDTASNTTAEVDFSLTDLVQYASIADIAGGMLFSEKGGSNSLTTVKIADVFHDRDGLSRQSRLRYDTPSLYGLSLAGSLVTNQRSDLALYWNGKGGGFMAAGALAVANPKLADSGLQYDGSVSVLHKNTGLNLTLSGGILNRDTLLDAINLYGKIGLVSQLIKHGHTAFGVDYTWSGNLPSSQDTAWSVGAAVVQSFTGIASDIYLQYRVHALDRSSGSQVENIHVGTVGGRVKF